MYVGPRSEKKRNEKATEKLQEHMEKESVRSEDSKISKYSNRAQTVACDLCDK